MTILPYVKKLLDFDRKLIKILYLVLELLKINNDLKYDEIGSGNRVYPE
jgi:hypothetical protein